MRKRLRGFDSNGVTISYLASGEGEPVILLHGFVFSIAPAWIAGGLFDRLKKTNRVVAMDLRGHGGSGKPHDPQRYGLEMIGDVLRLMDHLRFDRAHLVGYSLGGLLACKCLAVAPQRLGSVVLGGAGCVRDGEDSRASWIPLAEMLERVRPGETLSSVFWPDPNARPPREVQEIVDANDPAALAAVARGMPELSVEEGVLRMNRVPTLAICGELDPVKANVLAMQPVMRDLTVQVVPGLDHHTLPASVEFREAVCGFLVSRAGRQR